MYMSDETVYRVGHSPDPDDAFMFHAMTTGAIDTDDRKYEHVLFCLLYTSDAADE